MRDLKNKLTSNKNTKNIQLRKTKSFGYQVLGFGAGGGVKFSGLADFLVIAGGGGGGGNEKMVEVEVLEDIEHLLIQKLLVVVVHQKQV